MTTLAVINRLDERVAALEAPAALAPPAGSRSPTLLAMGLLFLAALPDAMVPPVLRGLLIDRYGASAAAAHWFMAVNLIGALLALPVLNIARRKFAPARLLLWAALVNSILLAALAYPIGLGPSLLVRFIEGAVDLLVVAVLFDLISKGGRPKHRGHRLGAAGTLMLLGLAAGAMVGGTLGRLDATLVFTAGGGACLALAVFALFAHRPLNQLVRFCPATEINFESGPLHRPLWPALGMAASDRALAGVLTASVPLYLSSTMELSPALLGGLLAVPLAMMALGSWPAGVLGDRVGHLRLRTSAALLYAAGFAGIPVLATVSSSATLMVLPMILIGAAGAALMPTSMAIASRSGRGSAAMGAYHAAGNIGFLVGILGAGSLIAWLGAMGAESLAYVTVIVGFACGHVFITTLTAAALRSRAPVDPQLATARVAV